MSFFKCRRYYLLFIVTLLLIAGCIQPITTTGSMDQHSDHRAEDAHTEDASHDGLMIVDAVLNETLPGAMATAAYLTIHNHTEKAIQWISAETAVAEITELHETVNDDGMMRMIYQPDGFTIPASGSLTLERGGKHIMLMELVEPLEAGQKHDIVLNFKDRSSVTLSVPVVAIGADSVDHGESSHAHEENESGN